MTFDIWKDHKLVIITLILLDIKKEKGKLEFLNIGTDNPIR